MLKYYKKSHLGLSRPIVRVHNEGKQGLLADKLLNGPVIKLSIAARNRGSFTNLYTSLPAQGANCISIKITNIFIDLPHGI
jgi:hypothetical protein